MNDKQAMISELHTLCAYPDKAAALLGDMEKAHPEAVRWLEQRLSALYENRRVETAAALPLPITELPKAEWGKITQAALLEEPLIARGGESQ